MEADKERRDRLHKFMAEATEWVCECGERCDPCSPKWRSTGSAWEHHHEYPMGHVRAHHEPKAETGEERG